MTNGLMSGMNKQGKNLLRMLPPQQQKRKTPMSNAAIGHSAQTLRWHGRALVGLQFGFAVVAVVDVVVVVVS